MTGEEMLQAADRMGNFVVAHSKSGKLYQIEKDVVRAWCTEPNSYLYGWPVKPHPRAPRGPVWFFSKNLRLAETDDQINT